MTQNARLEFTTIKETIETLKKAAKALSGVCDGAATLDGQGYNGTDSRFGKSLAGQDRWSNKQVLIAQKMLKKYAKQLAGHDIDIKNIPQLTMEDLEVENQAPRPAPVKAPARMNEVRLNAKDDSFEFWFAYDFDQKEFVKHSLKAKFHPMHKYWYCFSSVEIAEDVIAYAEQFNALITPEAQARIDHLTRRPDSDPAPALSVPNRELSKAEDADLSGIDLDGFAVEPFPFQRAGIAYGLKTKKVLIGDDMGLGKTIQALGIMHAAKIDRFIVLCPASVKLNWRREILKASSDRLTVEVWNGKAGKGSANVIVINYDNLKKHLAKLVSFGAKAIILDEVHYLKSEKAQRTQAAKALCDGMEYIIQLTGTPIMNRPSELISPLGILGHLDAFGGWFQFAKRYCQLHQKTIWIKGKYGPMQKKIWDSSGADNLVELNDRLRSLCMVRRRKADVLKELPAKNRAQVIFPIDNRKDYDNAEQNLIDYIRIVAVEDKDFLASIAHLDGIEREDAIREHQAERAESASRAEQLVQMELLKQIATFGKMEAAKEWIEDFLETGEKLLVFTTHVDAQTSLLRHFYGKTARIIAADSAEARQIQIEKFKTDPECLLMIASLKAGGTGIDGMQDACSNVAFLEMGWTPAEHMQAEDRLHRIGQDDSVNAYYMVAENTIEEKIQTMLAGKQAICDSVLDGAEEVKQGSIFNELVTLLTNKGK